jgi:hypothetical protein
MSDDLSWVDEQCGGKGRMKVSSAPDFAHPNHVVGDKATVTAMHFESFFESLLCRSQDFAGLLPKLAVTGGHVIETELIVIALDAILADCSASV